MIKMMSKFFVVFEQLWFMYDMIQLLGWMDQWDQMGVVLFDLDVLCVDMLWLYVIVYVLINGGLLFVVSLFVVMGELVVEISMEVVQLIVLLEMVCCIVQLLECLMCDYDSV